MQILLVVAGIVAAAHVANAFAPRRGRWSRVPSCTAAWLTTELAPHWLAAVLAVAIAGLLAGPGLWGWLGILLLVAAAAGLVVLILETRRTRTAMRSTLADLARWPEVAPSGGSVSGAPRFSRLAIAFPLAMGRRRGVQKLRNITYARVAGRSLALDLTLPARARPGDLRPVILQIHGGAWTAGDKRGQGQPLLYHLAAQGWIGVNANYRLSPGATFPDHLVDCKRAIAWIRSHIADYGGDPDNISVTGGSSGAHLAAMVALTANRPSLQPGFEIVDTAVQAAVLNYGAYDLTNRLDTWPEDMFRPIVEQRLIKDFLTENPESFVAASPIEQVHAHAPPVLIVHGTRDTICAVEDARLFARRMGEESRKPVLYAELPGTQHLFDVLPSLRCAEVVEGAERFLTSVLAANPATRTPDAQQKPKMQQEAEG